MLYESATGYLCDFIIYTWTETLYSSPNVKLPMPFENFKNTSKVVLSLFTAFYKKCYNLASTIYSKALYISDGCCTEFNIYYCILYLF